MVCAPRSECEDPVSVPYNSDDSPPVAPGVSPMVAGHCEPNPQGLAIQRKDLRSRTIEVLNRGGWANPDVLLVRDDAGHSVVVKDFAPRNVLVRTLIGPWITRREARAYRVLEGMAGVPALLGNLDALALIIEYRPGVLMSRSLAGRLPLEFMDELRTIVRDMHRRGVVHLDLRHRSNVLATSDGHPILIDFASAICLRPGGLLARAVLPLLALIDWGAVRKWDDRVGAGADASA